MTLTFELDLHMAKENQHTKYSLMGQTLLFKYYCLHTHTDTHPTECFTWTTYKRCR